MSDRRTTATIDGQKMSGLPCENCGTSYFVCTKRILRGQRACCGSCANHGTHDERRVQSSESERAEAVDRLLNERSRDSRGRFTRRTLDEWQTLIRHFEGAQAYLSDNDAELVCCKLRTRLGGREFLATYDGTEWSVEVVE